MATDPQLVRFLVLGSDWNCVKVVPKKVWNIALASELSELSDVSLVIMEFCHGVPGKVVADWKSLKLPVHPGTATELMPVPASTRMPLALRSVLLTILAALVSCNAPPVVMGAAGTDLREGRSFRITLIFW